jgi:hypothetical protein
MAVAMTAGLAACGGGTGTSGADQAAIETLLIHHYKAPSCGDLATSGRTAFGHPVDDTACAADIRKQAPKDVSVSKVKVDGDTATAVADGYTFKLQRVNHAWLIAG